MYFIPFASWLGLGTSSSTSASSSQGKEDNPTRKKKVAVVPPGTIGSWIVSYDNKGLPYWTNDVSDESTYRLLVQQTDQPGMPLKHVGDSRNPPWALPLNGPPPPSSSVAEAASPRSMAKRGGGGGGGGKGKASGDKMKKKGKRSGGGGDGGENDDGDGGSTRMGRWEELFDAVTGNKVWYNAVTLKKTTKDPFW